MSAENIFPPEKMNKIENRDCLEVLKDIPSGSVQIVFADPPFNLGKKYNSTKDNLTRDKYISWTRDWIRECVRILKPDGSIFVHNIPKWLVICSPMLEEDSFFKHWISWDAPTAPMGKSLQPAHYGILYYSKELKTKYYEIRHPHKRCRKRKCLSLLKDYGGKKDSLHPFGPLVSDVWTDIHRVKHNKYRDPHPCQLPIHLLERIILMSTEEGDIVFDPFMGTGTTAVASKRLGRNFYGSEVDKEYATAAINKVRQESFLSKIGDTWVGTHRGQVITLRNEDWEKISKFYEIPESGKILDFSPIKIIDRKILTETAR